MRKPVKWEAEIVAVLTLAGGALHYTKIAARIPKKDMQKATPKLISAALYHSMSSAESPIHRVGRGLYALRDRRARTTPRRKADAAGSRTQA